MILTRPLIKICSLRTPDQAEYVVAAGADAIGLIFAEGRRRVSPAQAAEIVGELRRLQGSRAILAIGVFVDEDADEINRVADRVGLDLVQLHGSEGPESCALVARPVIKAIRPLPNENGEQVLKTIASYDRAISPVAFLVDAYSAAAAGGTGERADWSTAAQIAVSRPMILAGGLTPENVAQAIATARPAGVDVSSGVETDGVKDREKVVAFVAAARAAFGRVGSDVGERGVIPLPETAEPVHRA